MRSETAKCSLAKSFPRRVRGTARWRLFCRNAALVCGGIGGGAIAALGAAGIRVFAGVEGDADSAAAAFAAGTLEYDANARCSHHEHHAEGDCGTHDCASHGCGTHGCGTHGCGR